MLQRLAIRNYAIIDRIEFTPSNGLNIITGETGAGKSILMGALGLVLGDRADSGVLLNKEEKCVVEAEFLANPQTDQLLKREELDGMGETVILRREINQSGKSRGFINDTPVNLQTLREAAAILVDLHRQFDSLELSSGGFQLNVLDAVAGTEPALEDYTPVYAKNIKAKKELNTLITQRDQGNRELDFNRFLVQELQDANLQPGELEELEQEMGLLQNAEGISLGLQEAIAGISEGDAPMASALKQYARELAKLSGFFQDLQPLIERLQSVQIELDDIGSDLVHLAAKINTNPQRLIEVEQRLDLGNRLLKKHRLSTTDELITLRASLESSLQTMENLDEAIAGLEKEIEASGLQMRGLAGAISEARKKAVPGFEKKVKELLGRVGMPNARLFIGLEPVEPGPSGADQVRFLFDANNTGRPEPLEKVISGGELSRLMLSIKSIVARAMEMPTLIFDEIDSGISGEAAKQVGILMRELAEDHQIISITHQPQIASRARSHYYVYKQNEDGTIRTRLRLLSPEEQVNTIAHMLGGADPSEALLQTAREMLAGERKGR